MYPLLSNPWVPACTLHLRSLYPWSVADILNLQEKPWESSWSIIAAQKNPSSCIVFEPVIKGINGRTVIPYKLMLSSVLGSFGRIVTCSGISKTTYSHSILAHYHWQTVCNSKKGTNLSHSGNEKTSASFPSASFVMLQLSRNTASFRPRAAHGSLCCLSTTFLFFCLSLWDSQENIFHLSQDLASYYPDRDFFSIDFK